MATIKSATAATAAIILSGSIIMYQRQFIKAAYCRCRGIEGILRYIWIGDYLPPNIREAMNKLDKVDIRMKEEAMQLDEIETLIERVELESVDGPISDLHKKNSNVKEASRSGKEDELKKQLFQQYPELRTSIALFSNRLDTLASTIDSVNSHQDMEIKTRKKKLSNKIVAMMSCLDNKMMSLGVRL